MEYIIENYTSEAGVRNLNRKLEKIILQLNVDKIYERGVFLLKDTNIHITEDIINNYLKEPNVIIRKIHSNDAGALHTLGRVILTETGDSLLGDR